jgi:hypothetical protein
MRRFLILNKEVFIVSYEVDAESPDEAVKKWVMDEGDEQVDMEYLSDLHDFTRHSIPEVIDITEE